MLGIAKNWTLPLQQFKIPQYITRGDGYTILVKMRDQQITVSAASTSCPRFVISDTKLRQCIAAKPADLIKSKSEVQRSKSETQYIQSMIANLGSYRPYRRGPFISLSKTTFRSTACPLSCRSWITDLASWREKPILAISSTTCK